MINRFKKFVCICGVCVLSLTTMSFMTVANAEDYADGSNGEAVYTTAPAAVYTEPVYTQSQEPANNNNVDSYTYAQDYTQAPVANDYSNESNDSQNTANYNFYNDDGEISDDGSDTDTDTNTDTDTDTNTDTDNNSDAGETTTPTYKNVKDIDDTELKDSDWDKISKELSKKKVTGKSASPFDYIKNSEKATGWDAFINNLNWASTLAIVAFALALICIIIFVIFTIKKIRIKRRGLPDVKVKSGKYENGSHAIIEDDEEDNFDEGNSVSDNKEEETVNIASHAKPAHGGAEDYGDDYDDEDFNDVHYVKPAEKSKKKKLKQDTSEIIIPNKYKR